MGKFNVYENFFRTKDDICSDYLNYLIKIGFVKESEREFFEGEGQDEVLQILLRKLYFTKIYNGVEVSSVSAFWHFCHFVVHKDIPTGREVWNDFVKQMFIDYEGNRNTCVMASRSLGKSFFIVLYSIFKMFLYKYTQIIFATNIPPQCIDLLRVFKRIVETNELLNDKKDMYKGKDLKWSEREIEYNSGYVYTYTPGSTPRGKHVNYIFPDDLIADHMNYSDDEIETFVFSELFPCVQRKRGRFCMTGTPIHLKDIFHFCMNEKEDFGGKLITDGRISAKGFLSRIIPIADKNGKPLFPRDYDEDAIQRIRMTQGDLKFEREYLLKVTDTSATMFPIRLTDACVDEQYKWEDMGQPSFNYIIGVDVATSGAASADFSAFIVLKLIPTKVGMKKVVVHIVHAKGMPISSELDISGKVIDEFNKGQADIIAELSKRFHNPRVIVEKNNVGVAVIQELIKRNIAVEQFVTDKYKKEGMVRYLVSEMQYKNMLFPPVSEGREIKSLLKELNSFGVKTNRAGKERMEALSGHDDLVIGLALANQAAQTGGSLPFAILQN